MHWAPNVCSLLATTTINDILDYTLTFIVIRVLSSWDTHRRSQPHHTVQVRWAKYSCANGVLVRWEHVIYVPYCSADTVLFQLLVVLVEEPLRIGGAPVTILLLTSLQDVQTHTGRRHFCSVWALLKKIRSRTFFLVTTDLHKLLMDADEREYQSKINQQTVK